jgi:hypothetical protein
MKDSLYDLGRLDLWDFRGEYPGFTAHLRRFPPAISSLGIRFQTNEKKTLVWRVASDSECEVNGAQFEVMQC